MMVNKDFAVFIATHGRAERVITYKVLRKQGYTGRVFIVIDDQDKQREEYKRIYGASVLEFDKLAAAKATDTGDCTNDLRAVVFARNEIWRLAKEQGVKYFMVLDDDYSVFNYKFNRKVEFGEWPIANLDAVFDAMLKYYKSTPALTMAMAQNGDFIGGKENQMAKILKPKRKAMNTFILSTERPFKFMGRINEDVNAYVCHGSRGGLFLQLNNVAIIQATTQQKAGGLTDIYLDSGTYVKSFYTILYSPSCVKISTIGTSEKRLHHKVKWRNAVPEILPERFKKK